MADLRFGSVAYDSQQVVFQAGGLDPRKRYQIGFSWWDFDHDTRVQSVWLAAGKGGPETKLLGKTKLPSAVANQPPDIKTLAIPPGLAADGALRIIFRNESEPNVLVSEILALGRAVSGQRSAVRRGSPDPAAVRRGSPDPAAVRRGSPDPAVAWTEGLRHARETFNAAVWLGRRPATTRHQCGSVGDRPQRVISVARSETGHNACGSVGDRPQHGERSAVSYKLATRPSAAISHDC